MADLSRGTRSRRAVRRPGWVLLTVLLVLAIGASSALVFTNKVELLKLAVILALWAAVVAAFVSVIYRRQSDIDQAKVRDLKLVYDLQLDREISARREYELTVETQLRRELTSEIRAQAADEVAGLRAELAALRANLEILFDADLSHRPALETDRSRGYGDWPRSTEAGRVKASRIDTEDREDLDANTEESPIIDVPAEPESDWAPPVDGGAHRRPSETEQERGRRHRAEEQSRAYVPPPSAAETTTQFTWEPPQQERPPAAPPEPAPQPPPPPPRPEPTQEPTPEPEPVAQGEDWQPAPAEGQWIPAGAPGSNWVAPPVPEPAAENGAQGEYVGRRRASEPAMQTPPDESRRGRHSAPADAVDPGRPPAPPTLHTEPRQPEPEPAEEEQDGPREGRRHRSAEDTGGQSVADLLARLQATPTGGGRRRRRDE
ncbi:DUF6779 domain-containing protein [Mycobacterium sp. NPDC048908]|uniref:DUF6779 domain-containing protein n=1 Tax=Mycobacterium sp. NPDC048908 TaxID=3364292 RepID=UPI0037186F17